MSVSVVTVALNAAKDLPLTIESVVAQDHRDLEYIVLDGMSVDSTEEVLARYSAEIDKVLRFEDDGVYQAMNHAATVASKDYVIFLNAGDRFVDESAISRMIARLESDVDIFYGNHIFIDKGVEYFHRSSDFGWLRSRLLYGRVDGRWHSRVPCHQATFTRTQWLREQPYDPRFTICADHHFLFSAYDRGARLQFIDETVAQYFAGGFSSKNGAKLQREWALAYRSHSLRPAKVDEHMFGGAANSPFPAMHAYSGLVVDGLFSREGPYPDFGPLPVAWASIPRLRSPRQFYSAGLNLVGFNRIDQQELNLKSGDRHLARLKLPLGKFEIYAPFSDLLENDAEVMIYPTQIAALAVEDPRAASFMLIELYFKPIVPHELEIYSVAGCDRDLLRGLLKSGWSDIEDTHVWSTDEAAKLVFPSLARPKRIVLHAGSSPLFHSNQHLTIALNGRDVATRDIGRGSEPLDVVIDDLANWGDGVNELALKVPEVRPVTGDNRKLGVALYGFRVER